MWYLLILMDILAWSLLALWWFRLRPNPRRRPKKYRPVLNMVPLGSDFYGPLLVAGTMIGQRHFRWEGPVGHPVGGVGEYRHGSTIPLIPPEFACGPRVSGSAGIYG